MERHSLRPISLGALASRYALTELGLDYWGLELRRSANGRDCEFLLTLALEGGFPVRILAEGARGWLKAYLRTIMRRAISARVESQDEILAIAREERGRMRKTYDHDDFVALCSELVAVSLTHDVSAVRAHLRASREGDGGCAARTLWRGCQRPEALFT